MTAELTVHLAQSLRLYTKKCKHASTKLQQVSEASIACLKHYRGLKFTFIQCKCQIPISKNLCQRRCSSYGVGGVPSEDLEQLGQMCRRVSQGRSRFRELSHSSRGCCRQDVAQRAQRMCQGHIVIVLLCNAHGLIQR